LSDVPPSHPRYASLKTREKVVEGVEKGITGLNGLIAQGRGGHSTTSSARGRRPPAMMPSGRRQRCSFWPKGPC